MKISPIPMQSRLVRIAAASASLVIAATVFAPAGFGSDRARPRKWQSRPIIVRMDPSVEAGSQALCAITFDGQPEGVTVYSDPPGAVSYSGPVSGTETVIPVTVSPDAEPGTVEVFAETDGSSTASTTTTVVEGG
ncbi:MAG: hypothetical protein H7Z41_18660 [Cytophagales bacterium]|nr:hypothetical protein [Armatimonadota bacterium]